MFIFQLWQTRSSACDTILHPRLFSHVLIQLLRSMQPVHKDEKGVTKEICSLKWQDDFIIYLLNNSVYSLTQKPNGACEDQKS